MLKLKTNQKRIHLIVVHKKWLTPSLLNGLMIAFGIHLFAFFLFHVELFTWIEFPPSLATIEVVGDFGVNQEGVVFADDQTKAWNEQRIKPPAKSSIIPPKAPYTLSEFPMEIALLSEPLPHLSFNGDLIDYDLSHLNEFSGIPFEIKFAGDLAFRKMMYQPKITLPQIETPLKLLLDVKLDEKTGKLFWLNWINRSGLALVDQTIEKWLTQLEIESNPNQFISSGLIEIYVNS